MSDIQDEPGPYPRFVEVADGVRKPIDTCTLAELDRAIARETDEGRRIKIRRYRRMREADTSEP